MPPRRSRPPTSPPRPLAGRGPRARSYGRAADGDPADPDMALARPNGSGLTCLAAEARLHLEVGADSVDPRERLQAVADQRGSPAGRGDFAALDQVALGDAEDEVAGRRLDLPAAERDGVEAPVHLGDDRLGVGMA